jgi:hypothetical protein
MRLSSEKGNIHDLPKDKVVMTALNKPDFTPIRAPRKESGYD